MKTALIIVSIVGGLALIAAVILGIKTYKTGKMLKDPKQIWEAYVATLPTYANNSDALEGGMKVGEDFKTPAGQVLKVVAATA